MFGKFQLNLNPTSRFCCLRRFFASLNLPALNERGLVNNVHPPVGLNFSDLISSKTSSVYAGFDPTAESLHVGNLLPLIGLLHFQRAGIHPIVLIGGATAVIGDPSGKTSAREEISKDTIRQNVQGLQKNVEQVFHNHAKYFWKKPTELPPFRFINNLQWYSRLCVLDFLGTTARHFRMGTMLLKDSVQSRLNSPDGMSFAEFSYQTFQAYDWLQLYLENNCVFQLGGNDQLGNMTAGYDLIKRTTGQSANCYCFTVPLVKSEAGDKLGKTAGNAVWLDKDKTSAFDLYQYFLRVPDAEVGNLLLLFTFLPMTEIEDVMASHEAKPESRKAQKRLAEQVTLLVHGEEALDAALRGTDALFNANVKALASLDFDTLTDVFGKSVVSHLSLKPGITVLDVVMGAKCFAEERDARRVINAGGVYINYNRVPSPEHVLLLGAHILPNNTTLIRVGKKNYYVVRWNT